MSEVGFYSKEVRPWLSDRLTSASLIGHTTPRSVELWLRVLAPGSYELVVRRGAPVDTAAIAIRSRGGRRVVVDRRGNALEDHLPVRELTFSHRRDLTRVVELKGLEPGTRYHYALRRKEVRDAFQWEWELGFGTARSFRTHDEDPERVAFGLFSCHMPFDTDLHDPQPVNMELWKHFREELLDAGASLVIGGGDQVYTDGHAAISIWKWLQKVKDRNPSHGDMVSWYRDIYRGYWGMDAVQAVFRSFPTYMTWDDHEIKDGWGSYTDDELSDELDTLFEWEDREENLRLAGMMWKAAQQVYDEYEHCHNPDPPRKQAGDGSRNWHYAFECGPCAFFVLDLRGHRFYRSDDDAAVLGEEQLADFERWITREADDSEVLFVVSSVPLVHASSFVVNWLDLPFSSLKDDFRDHWEHASHLAERERLLDLVFRSSHETGRRVAFLSGDVHVAASMKLVSPRDYPGARVYQITSSGITYAGLSSVGRRVLKMVVRDDGPLHGARGGPKRGTYKQLHEPLARNNFGIMRVAREEGGVGVSWDLYGKSEIPGGIVRLSRLALD